MCFVAVRCQNKVKGLRIVNSAATRTLFLGGKVCFWGTKFFGLRCFSPSSLLISKKKQKKTIRSLFQFGQRLSEFFVDLKKTKGHPANLVNVCPSSLLISKKKGHLAKLFYLSPNFLSVCQKKSHHLKTAKRERGVWVGMLGILERRNFF